MRQKKRYVLLKSYPSELPMNSKFLFQNSSGYVIKTDLKGAELLRKQAILISGSIWKLKGEHQKSFIQEKLRRKVG